MEFTGGQYAQLIIALAIALVLFQIAYWTPIRVTVPCLILIIPFQFIASRYGSANMLLTYLVGLAVLFKGREFRVPLFGVFLLMAAVYLASLSQAPRSTYVEHVLYLASFGAAVILFYLTYNYVREVRSPRRVIRLLLTLDFLVVLYCNVQLMFGFEQFSFLGVSELSMLENRDDQRLAGPFNAVGITAEFLVLSVFLIAYELLHERNGGPRLVLYALLAANFAFLVATGNRGGFLSLLGGGVLFLYLFRKEMGVGQIIGIVGGSVLLFSVMATVIIQYTEFDQLFDRLQETEVESGVPDTRRVVWAEAWTAIQERPLLGHGPRLRMSSDWTSNHPAHDTIGYPHNLYLFLLYTTGVPGLIAFLLLFASVMWRNWKAGRSDCDDRYQNGLPRLAQLLVIVLLVDQIKVEFMRFGLADYQQYVFCLLGALVAFADLPGRGRQPEIGPVEQGAGTRPVGPRTRRMPVGR